MPSVLSLPSSRFRSSASLAASTRARRTAASDAAIDAATTALTSAAHASRSVCNARVVSVFTALRVVPYKAMSGWS
eukprot:15838-Pelagococcus_subviridis.AAC.1